MHSRHQVLKIPFVELKWEVLLLRIGDCYLIGDCFPWFNLLCAVLLLLLKDNINLQNVKSCLIFFFVRVTRKPANGKIVMKYNNKGWTEWPSFTLLFFVLTNLCPLFWLWAEFPYPSFWQNYLGPFHFINV